MSRPRAMFSEARSSGSPSNSLRIALVKNSSISLARERAMPAMLDEA